MAMVKRSILINQPVDVVFQFIADFENYPEWNHSMLECKRTSEDPTSAGVIFNSKMVYMGRQYSAPLEIKEYDLNKKIAFYAPQFSFFKWFSGIFYFKQVNGSTRVTVNAATDFLPLFKPMLVVMPILGRLSWGKHLNELKRILESKV